MRRVNIQAAFLGEGGEGDTGDEEGLALVVRGGEVVLVLPAGTSEDRAVSAATTVRGALRLLTFHDITGMPVVDGGQVVGVISEADLIGKSGATVGEVMTTPAISVRESTRLEDVAHELTQRRIRRLPVVDADNRLLGMVSRADVLRWAAGRRE